MPSITQTLTDRGLIRPPDFIPTNVQYEAIVGSVAYGISGDTSDIDVRGFCIPPKNVVFPHLAGDIIGFGRHKKRFNQFQAHHIEYKDAGKEYDLVIYGIVRFFTLCMECNPNMIDCLFTPRNCVLHCTQVGNMVREGRKLFLHKGAWPRFKGYAYSQLHKMQTKSPAAGSKRLELREKFGFDVKFAYHVVRLLDEAEQILTLGDIDLQRAKEHLKAIKRGDVPEAEIRRWASDKEAALEKVYEESSLPWGPDEEAIKILLLACLEHHYGTLDAACIVLPNAAETALAEIGATMKRYYVSGAVA